VINYITGDATRPQGAGTKVIVHCCNDLGLWGSGFVLALSERWKLPEREYKRWKGFKETDDSLTVEVTGGFALGEVQFVKVEHDLWVANIIGQRGVVGPGNLIPVRYEALQSGLKAVAAFAQKNNVSVHMPRLGAGLAGGDWDIIEHIVEHTLVWSDVGVTVYDLPPQE